MSSVLQSMRELGFVKLFAGEKLQLAFKIAYVVLTMLSFNSFCAETKFLSYASYALAGVGALILLARLVKFPSFKQMPLLPLTILFSLSFILSAALSAKYGIMQNVQGFAWLTFEFFILFLHSFEESKEHACFELDCLAFILLAYTLLCSAVGVAMGVMGYYDYLWWGTRTMNVFGVYAGRLWGVYSDPNIGAVLCLLSLLFAAWLWRRKKLPLPLLALHLFVQLSYVSLAGSRTATIACVAVAFVVTGLWAVDRFSVQGNRAVSAVLKALAVALVCAAVSLGGMLGFGTAWSSMATAVQSSPEYVQPKALFREVLQWDTSTWVSEEDPDGIAYTEGTLSSDSEESEEGAAGEASGAADEGAEGAAEGATDEGFAVEGAVAEGAADTSASDQGAMGLGARTDKDAHDYGSSSSRLSIWKSAWEIFLTNPLVGTSHRNILPYALDVLPDTYISQLGYSTMHNVLMDTLVSQGIIGAIILIAALVVAVRRTVLFWRHAKLDALLKAVVIAGLIAVAISAMFYTEILYINSPLSILFWILLGFVCFVGRIDEHCSGESLRR